MLAVLDTEFDDTSDVWSPMSESKLHAMRGLRQSAEEMPSFLFLLRMTWQRRLAPAHLQSSWWSWTEGSNRTLCPVRDYYMHLRECFVGTQAIR